MRCLAGACLLAVLATAAHGAAPANLTVVEDVWREARAHVHPESLVDSHFTPEARAALDAAARNADDLYALAPAINAFLDTLGRSHTGFHHDRSLDFYLYRSMFTTRDPERPLVFHAGIQHRRHGETWVVREVWDGLPAARAGVRRGDRLIAADGGPYDPYAAFNPGGGAVLLTLERCGRRLTVRVEPVQQNPNESLLRAMHSSERRIRRGDVDVGYLHLWSGTHPRSLDAYLAAIARLAAADAMVLDLRGGFGGAWYDYLDPFFDNRDDYFRFTVEDRAGERAGVVGSRRDVVRYTGPLVVLINEGTRSGKEALAYQFKRSGRAVLVGVNTRGAFTAGRGLLTDLELPYFLFLASAEYRLDGNVIEGVGVAPDVVVPFVAVEEGTDAQLERALALAVTAAASR